MKKYAQWVIGALMLCVASGSFSSEKKQPSKDFMLLNISGLEGGALTNVTSRLTIKKQRISAAQVDTVPLRFYQDIPAEVKKALEPYGYFRAVVNTSVVRTPEQWIIAVRVRPGPRLRFTRIDVAIDGAGLGDRAFTDYVQHLPIQVGGAFDSESYEKIKATLQNMATARGYFQAKWTQAALRINLLRYTSEIVLHYDTGPRYHFGPVNFSAAPISTKLLTRYLTFAPNMPYDVEQLEESRKNLAMSNYFSQVLMTPDVGHPDVAPIDVQLFPQNQVTYSLGAGYGTDTGIRGMVGTHIRWLNDAGHSANVQIRASQQNDELAMNYSIPGRHPAQDSYNFNAGVMRIDQITGTAENVQGGFVYRTQIAPWRMSLGMTYLIENYTLNNYPTSDQNTHTNANVLYPQITLQRLYSNKNFINPDYGYNFSAMGAAGNNFESNTSFSEVRTDIRALYTIDAMNLRVLTRLSLGSIVIDDLIHLPLSMQFYAGGAQSIRGYQYNSIGPGTELMVGSLELQEKIIGHLYIAGFIDAGNVSSAILDEPIKIGAGPAFVYLSPVGAIEISCGRQIAQAHGPWAIQFSMGTLL